METFPSLSAISPLVSRFFNSPGDFRTATVQPLASERTVMLLQINVSNLNFYFLIPKSLNPPQRDQLSGHRRSWQNRHGRGCRA